MNWVAPAVFVKSNEGKCLSSARGGGGRETVGSSFE